MTKYVGSEHVKVSKIVRAYLKELGLKGKVKGSFEKVSVRLEDNSLVNCNNLKELTKKHESSFLNGYEDLVEVNYNHELPQVEIIVVC